MPRSEYFAQPQAKSRIALHHTVCDSARRTLDIWGDDDTPGGSPRRVVTAYVIERDGTIYEAFDPACWFVIDHANAESWRAQKDQLLAVDSLRVVVTALQDSVTRLVAANADAYQTGYQAAYAAHQDLTERHIAELRKPRIRLGSGLGLLGAAAVGLVLGRAMPCTTRTRYGTA